MKDSYRLVTQSAGKLEEFNKIMGSEIKPILIDLPEIQSIDVKEVVRAKLIKAYEIAKEPVIVEDTGVYIKAWNNFPGALIKWMIQTVGISDICKMLDNFNSRDAYAETVIGIHNGEKQTFFYGIVNGKISNKPQGSGGFGWDQIFIPDNEDKTFGEMELDEKNKFSMRKKAIIKIMEYFENS